MPRPATRRWKDSRFWNGASWTPKATSSSARAARGHFPTASSTPAINDPRMQLDSAEVRPLRRTGARSSMTQTPMWARTVLQNRGAEPAAKQLLALGGEVRFAASAHGTCDGERTACTGGAGAGTRAGGSYPADGASVLAIGHSARDTFRDALRIPAFPWSRSRSPWACASSSSSGTSTVAQYGERQSAVCPRRTISSPCSIRTAARCYTFCMCPGGLVVAAASQPGGVVTNGMSYADARTAKTPTLPCWPP